MLPRLLLILLSLLFAMSPAEAKRVALVVGNSNYKSFGCGDNCYLTISTKSGKEVTALCVATTCDPWNSAGEITPKLVGRNVIVTIGTGMQLYGSGEAVGDYPAFTDVTIN